MFANVSWKETNSKYFRHYGLYFSVNATHFCYCSMKATTSKQALCVMYIFNETEIWVSCNFHITKCFPSFDFFQTLKNVGFFCFCFLKSLVHRPYKNRQRALELQGHNLLILLMFPRLIIYKNHQPQEGALGFALWIQSKNLRLGLCRHPKLTRLVQVTLYKRDLLKDFEAQALDLFYLISPRLFHDWPQMR